MFAPNPDAVGVQLSSDYAANVQLSVWSHALLNTNLFPIDPKPSWFDRVAADFAGAQSTTKKWLFEDYPSLAAALPQSLIDYGNTFGAGVDELIPLMAKPTLSAQDRADVRDVIGEMKKQAVTQQFRVRGMQKKVEAFSKFVIATAAKMQKHQTDILASLGEARKDVEKLQSRITDIYRELGITATEAKIAMEGAAMKGISIAGSLLTFTIGAAVTTGVSAPVIGVAIAILALTIGAIEEKAKSESVLAKIREITALQVKLTSEQAQAASLQSIVNAIDALNGHARTSMTNMTGSVHYWDDILDGLETAAEIVALDDVDPKKFTMFRTLAAAKKSWETIVDHAGNIQRSVLRLEPPIEIGGTAA